MNTTRKKQVNLDTIGGWKGFEEYWDTFKKSYYTIYKDLDFNIDNRAHREALKVAAES